MKKIARENLLEVKNLKAYFYMDEGIVKAVDGVSFEISPGEILGIAGESGCGKSVTALSIMRLLPQPPGKIVDGKIYFKGKNLLNLEPEEMRKVRISNISMIFQEPMISLNPVFTVGNQISEAILNHKNIKYKEAIGQTLEMMRKVGIPLPEKRINEYPHQMSGGMNQRIMIAMALSCNPQLLIADEPTTALDVTTQAQILDLLKELKERFKMAIMIITHDMGVIAELSDRVVVMYAGKIVEVADVRTILINPKHPYTWGLMKSIPRLDKELKNLYTIPGMVPNRFDLSKDVNCAFSARCPIADNKCFTEEPELKEVDKGHQVRCWHIDKLEAFKKLNL